VTFFDLTELVSVVMGDLHKGERERERERERFIDNQ
jgi:hypothetical protein